MKKHETKKINWIKITKTIVIILGILWYGLFLFAVTIAPKIYSYLQMPLNETIIFSIMFGLNIVFLIGLFFNKWSLIGHTIMTIILIIYTYNGNMSIISFLIGPILLFAIMYKEFFSKYH